MKKIINIVSFMTLALLLTSCGKDNYSEPTSTLTGQIIYQDSVTLKETPIQLRGTGGAVSLQLYQDGYANPGNITIFVDQDGTFRAKLFDGVYKMVTKDKNGPWVNTRDTSIVIVKGNTVFNRKVKPYFILTDDAITLTDSIMDCSCNITAIVPDAVIGSVSMIIGNTKFVDDSNKLQLKTATVTKPGPFSFKLNLNLDNKEKTWASIKASKELYARIAVKAKGADQAVYTKLVKLR